MYSLNTGFLLLLLFTAAWHDIRSRRIPNALVFAGTIAGVLSNTLLPQELGGLGVFDSLAGLGIGLVLLLPLYVLRAMAAGDVKLMAMTGAFLGAWGATGALLYVLLAGGVLALATAWHQGTLNRLLRKLRMMLFTHAAGSSMENLPMTGNVPGSAADAAESMDKLPYGVAIATGTSVYLAVAHWG